MQKFKFKCILVIENASIFLLKTSNCYILFITSFIAVKNPIKTLKAAKASKNCVTTVPSYRHIAAKPQNTTAARRSVDKFARLYGVGSCVTKGCNVIERNEATVLTGPYTGGVQQVQVHPPNEIEGALHLLLVHLPETLRCINFTSDRCINLEIRYLHFQSLKYI